MSKQKKITVNTRTGYNSPQKKINTDSTALHFGFLKMNYKWMFVGLGLNALGFLLMIGGGTNDPNVFNEETLFSPIRLTASPMLIIGGYVVMIFAIMKKNKVNKESSSIEN